MKKKNNQEMTTNVTATVLPNHYNATKIQVSSPVNAKPLCNIYTMLDQCRRSWANIV